jgi:hypothetical protein
MLLQDAPILRLMIAGYAVFFVISAIYLLSLILRRRNLERDLETLRLMEAESGRPSRSTSAAALSPTRPRGSRPQAARRKPARKKVTRRK